MEKQLIDKVTVFTATDNSGNIEKLVKESYSDGTSLFRIEYNNGGVTMTRIGTQCIPALTCLDLQSIIAHYEDLFKVERARLKASKRRWVDGSEKDFIHKYWFAYAKRLLSWVKEYEKTGKLR